RALQLKPDYATAMNNLAQVLATDADARLRDGAEAVQLARRACELSGGKTPGYAATLAAAYAETGQFSEAATAANQAIALAQAAGDQKLAAANTRLLELYRAHQPYHQKPSVSEAS